MQALCLFFIFPRSVMGLACGKLAQALARTLRLLV
jgi:hypothetical protein